MPRSVQKVTEGSGAYYGRYQKEMETEGGIQKEPEV